MATVAPDWIAVDLLTGRVIAELPDLTVTGGPLALTIGRYETATVSLPLDGAPVNWQAACGEYTSVLVALDADRNPLWGGIVDQPTKTANASNPDAVGLRLVTAEGFFDRRYTGNRVFTQTGQNAIAANVVASFALSTGLPARIVGGTGGKLRDRTYLDSDDRTVYSALSDLMADEGGLEWSVGWEWQHAPERITPVVTFGDVTTGLLGTAPPDGARPNATFSMPGPVIEATEVGDYGSGRGANRVRAYGSFSTSGARPYAEVTSTDLRGRPLVEYRFTPSTSITDMATLTRHATQALAALEDGSVSLKLTAAVEDAPRLNVDWSLGDTIGYNLTAAAWPNGLVGQGRCIGWQLDPGGTWVAPVLVSA